MNDQSSTQNDPLSPQKPALSADALTRRRLMLRGATGGAAALAALQPVGALATSQSTVLTCLNGAGKEALCTLLRSWHRQNTGQGQVEGLLEDECLALRLCHRLCAQQVGRFAAEQLQLQLSQQDHAVADGECVLVHRS